MTHSLQQETALLLELQALALTLPFPVQIPLSAALPLPQLIPQELLYSQAQHLRAKATFQDSSRLLEVSTLQASGDLKRMQVALADKPEELAKFIPGRILRETSIGSQLIIKMVREWRTVRLLLLVLS